jgi:hypothetical protein
MTAYTNEISCVYSTNRSKFQMFYILCENEVNEDYDPKLRRIRKTLWGLKHSEIWSVRKKKNLQ